jgi:hypothetical protein
VRRPSSFLYLLELAENEIRQYISDSNRRRTQTDADKTGMKRSSTQIARIVANEKQLSVNPRKQAQLAPALVVYLRSSASICGFLWDIVTP